MTAILGVLLNLILGLYGVVLAMDHRGDLPAFFAQLDNTQTPRRTVLFVGADITGLGCLANVKTTWSFSAFTVLVYYAITNLAAIRPPPHQRLYPRVVAYIRLAACLFLAFWVEPRIWLVGQGLVIVGLAWHQVRTRCGSADTAF